MTVYKLICKLEIIHLGFENAEIKYKYMDYLNALEAEAIYIFREVAGQFKRAVLLFSGSVLPDVPQGIRKS